MTKFYTDMKMSELVTVLEKGICPRTYWLHSSVGSSEWRVERLPDSLFKKVTVPDPSKATFVLLQIPTI
jgi:hypothetical protein